MSDVLITVHYEVWDEDALEAGDTDERGTDMDDEPHTWGEAIRAIRNSGPWETDSNPVGFSWLSSTDDDINYRTGEHTRRSMHIRRRDGSHLSTHQIQRLYRAAGVIK